MEKRKHRELVFLLFAASVVLAIIFKSLWITIPGFVLLLAGLGSPFLGKLIYTGWMKLAGILSVVSGSLLFTLVFYLVLTPVSFFYRLSKKEKKTSTEPTDSYYISHTRIFDPEMFTKTW